MKTYKVYVIKERITEVVKYVGLTSQTLHKRFMQHVFTKKLDTKDYFIQLVQEDLTLDQAVVLEELLIVQYQTRAPGWNVAKASINGYSNQHTDEQKAKWSKERKGKEFKGRQNRITKNTAEHNAKISEAHCKPLICLDNGKVYNSISQAAKELGLSVGKVSMVVNGKRPHTKGYKFKFL